MVASKLQLFHAIFGSEDSDTEPEGDSNVSGSTKSKKLQKKPKVKYVFSWGEKHCPPPNYWGIGPQHPFHCKTTKHDNG